MLLGLKGDVAVDPEQSADVGERASGRALFDEAPTVPGPSLPAGLSQPPTRTSGGDPRARPQGHRRIISVLRVRGAVDRKPLGERRLGSGTPRTRPDR